MIERMPRWLVGLLLGGSTIVICTLANPAQAQLRRAYKGNLECGQTPATSLAIIVSAGSISADVPTYDIDGLLISPAMAGGSVDPAGVLRFGYTISSPKSELRAHYTVTLSGVGGTLTGTQVLTRATGGDSITRTCKGTVFEVELPKK